MNRILVAGCLAALPLRAMSALVTPAVAAPEVWSQALALLKPSASEVRLSASSLPGGVWFDVLDPGLGIRLMGRPAANGIVKFNGRAGSALAFEARPLDQTQPPSGYLFVSRTLSARVVRSGEGFILEGQAGGKPLALTLQRGSGPHGYEVIGRDGSRLEARIRPSYARLSGRFDPERMSPEGLGVLGAAVALMFPNG